MPTPRQTQFIEPLIQALNSIAQFEPVNLVAEKKLGSELSFEFLLPLFIEVISTVNKLRLLHIDKIPYQILSQLATIFGQINSILQQIASFSPGSHGNPLQARDALAQSLEDSWNAIYITVRTLLGSGDEDAAKNEIDVLLSQVNTSVQLSSEAAESLRAKQSEISNNLDTFIKEKTEAFEKEGSEKLKLVSNALDEVRKAAAEAGVSQTSAYFKIEANDHLLFSQRWLRALCAVIICLILFSLFGTDILRYFGTATPDKDSSNIQLAIFLTQKGLIVFCLIFALIMSAKNYGAARHNYVVNKHRNNALSSFQAFATSAADEQTKSAVLIQATQSIFTPQASGYVKNDGENSASSPIIEILRSAGATGK